MVALFVIANKNFLISLIQYLPIHGWKKFNNNKKYHDYIFKGLTLNG